MPIYEYKCLQCGEINSFLEKIKGTESFFEKWFNKKRCKVCKSKNLSRIISSFATHRTQTPQEMIDDLKKMGPVNFVPDYRPLGPPGGKCPYEQTEEKKEEQPKKRERIEIK